MTTTKEHRMRLNPNADIDVASLDTAVDTAKAAIWAAAEGPDRKNAARAYFQAQRDRDDAIRDAVTRETR